MIGMGTQGVRGAKTGGRSQEGLDVVIAKNIRSRLPTLAIKDPFRWNLMARVFSVAKTSEPDNDTQTVMALGLRGALLGPRDRSLGHNMRVTLCRGKLRKTSQIALHGVELEICRPADSKIRINSVYQHNVPSGHGLATC